MHRGDMETKRNRRLLESRGWIVVQALFSVLLCAMLWPLPEAAADEDQVARIRTLSQTAMKSFDELEYEKAKKLLIGLVDKAKAAGLERDQVLAEVYLDLGIVYFSGDNDVENARENFRLALDIDPNLELPKIYVTPDMEALFNEVRGQVQQERGGDTGGAVDCAKVEGFSHNLIDEAEVGMNRPVEAVVGSDLKATRVALYYRVQGGEGASEDFTEVPMKSADGCTYAAVIPGSALKSGAIHYYVAAYDGAGTIVGSSGSDRTPNIMDITAGGDTDNPLGSGESPPLPKRIFLFVGAGTGGGYVSGKTEQVGAPVNCCLAPAPLHVAPELGYYLSRKASIAAAFRLGFPLGANRDNHATAAPALIVRYRQALAPAGKGLFFSAALGGGVIRQTVQLAAPDDPNMNVDTTAIGPLLVGGGIGYVSSSQGTVRFIAEVSTTMGVPVIGEVGNAQLNFGIQLDLNLGVQFAF